MGEINLSSREKDALSRLDRETLAKAVARAIDDEQLNELYPLGLSDCGAYVAAQYGAFQRVMTYHQKSKSSKKWEATHDDLRRAGYNLTCALDQMHRRMQQEDEEGQLFRVHDDVFYPHYVGVQMSVTVRYQWRRTINEKWKHSRITFEHTAQSRPDYSVPVPKRKPSAAKVREEREEKLRREWEHLMRGALYSVQAYLREGRDPAAIPETFNAVVDSYDRCLNNHSTKFWLEKP